MSKAWGPTTTAIHAGKHFNTTRAVTTPIFQTSVFQLMENQEGATFSASVEPRPSTPAGATPTAARSRRCWHSSRGPSGPW